MTTAMPRAVVSLLAVGLAGFVSACSAGAETRQTGEFTIRTSGDSGGRPPAMALRHNERVLTAHLTDSTVDPRRPHRIVFASRDAAACGTFFFDASTNVLWKMSRRLMIVHGSSDDDPHDVDGNTTPWSPDGRLVFAGNETGRPVAFDLVTRTAYDLATLLSTGDRFVDLRATVWSPDSHRLAVEIAADGYNGRDLAAVTVSPFGTIEYVASMHGAAAQWTRRDYHWQGESLALSEPDVNGRIERRDAAALSWHAAHHTSIAPTTFVTDGNCP
jgi:hypothetical protein